MIYVLFAILGLLVGGVINVLADDLPRRVRPQLPHCPKCERPYGPLGWLSVGRWLALGGRCARCGQAERRRPIVVEMATAVVFALLPLWVAPGAPLWITAFYFAVLILVIVIDMEHRLILHIVTFPTTLIALLLSNFQGNGNSFLMALAGAATGFIVFYILYWIGQVTFGPGALGFGDVTLSMTMGAMLGFQLIIFALVIGILLGGLTSLLLILVRVLHMRSRIPYGQFLATSAMIMLLWGPQIVAWYLG